MALKPKKLPKTKPGGLAERLKDLLKDTKEKPPPAKKKRSKSPPVKKGRRKSSKKSDELDNEKPLTLSLSLPLFLTPLFALTKDTRML